MADPNTASMTRKVFFFLQLEQQLLVHIAYKRRKRLQLVSEKNNWPLFAAKGDYGLIGYCTRWQGSWLQELQRTYLLQWRNIEEVLYNYCVLNLAFSFFFLFFLFLLKRKLSVFEHLL